MTGNIVVVGSGSIGMRHVRSLRALLPAARFSFVREFGRAASTTALEPGFGVYTSLDEAMAARPDLLVIANPSSLHLRYLLAAIAHQVPFYVEKPVVTSRADLAALQAALAVAGPMPVNMVGCNLRFLPSLVMLRGLLAEQAIGRVVRASFEAGQWLPDWRPQQDYAASYSARRELGGGVLLDLIHETDASRWLLGDFAELVGMTGKFSGLEIETEDVAALVMRRPQGPLVTVQLDYVSRTPVRRYSFVGERGTLEWNLPKKRLVLTGEHGIETVLMEGEGFDVPATYPAAMAELLAAIDAGRPSTQPLEEGLSALAMIFSARKDN